MRLKIQVSTMFRCPMCIDFEIRETLPISFQSQFCWLPSKRRTNSYACCLLRGCKWAQKGLHAERRRRRRKQPKAFSCDLPTFAVFLAFEISDGEKYKTRGAKSKSWKTLRTLYSTPTQPSHSLAIAVHAHTHP